MKRILIIESDPVYRTEICRVLRFEKYQVITAKSGMDGLNLALTQHPDLVLCDIQTSDLSGYEVLGKLRSDYSTLRIPFIFLAGKTDSCSHLQAMYFGACAYFSKSSSYSQLLRVIANRLQAVY